MNSLEAAWHQLGITADHLAACRLPAYPEATRLVDAGCDLFGRPQQMTRTTLAAWSAMRAAARNDSIELQLVSAYRSVAYQCDVIERKLAAGRSIDEILRVNAPPGHSEHHTGRALDLTSPGVEALTEAFETTDAFSWLSRRAEAFGFALSYPRDNPEGIDYEPWHWARHADPA